MTDNIRTEVLRTAIELINGDGKLKKKIWSISDCNITFFETNLVGIKEGEPSSKIDLNKIILKTFKPYLPSVPGGFQADCVGICNEQYYGNKETRKSWVYINQINWERNVEALSHLYSNFCTGAKTAF